ncbi:MAG: replicative DNA helicase [Gammaproteobacteria bacterium]|jgi:replicative DNA helicase|nr:replicative DNA helicase [Gammaproteobacteria bacterium]MBT6755613.1 replicative DNA helicase [Gammaproteobacteria bacterium]MBT7523902.1 replicative DNA helicase [Gammaproteobacteria bacterium]MBT7815035.1 replicative DNA helicase [Gammaproteobacteria bacterium]MDC3385917.1 replicative DNA helicase [Gammaproteobacteria bacterium]|tara:strand:- start:59 stop:1423 length:1365 start_codon:yes stop_codon:yes gene_type:complete
MSKNLTFQSLNKIPNSIEAEIAVLGGLILDNESWEKIADILQVNDFYNEQHRKIYSCIVGLVGDNTPFDVVTINEKVNTSDDKSFSTYLSEIINQTPSAANIKAYANIVREQSILRQLISVSNNLIEKSRDGGIDSKSLLDEAERTIFNISEESQKTNSGFQDINKLVQESLKEIEKRAENGDAVTGVATGFTDFDNKTTGLQGGDLIIVAGRPSMGKTSFAMNLAEYASLKNDAVTAIFSMEMSGTQLSTRLISSMGRINQQKIRTGKLTDDDWPRLTNAIALLSKANIFIDDTPALTPTDIRARARRLKREKGLDLIVIDYMQLMQLSNNSENRATELSEISRSLKALARELDVPVVALSQLNRSLENRTDKRPIMSDLRESGAIEQDADLIAFIYRDEVYNEDSPDKGKAEILVRKQRNGPIFTTTLTFLGECTRFENYTPEIYSAPEAFK